MLKFAISHLSRKNKNAAKVGHPALRSCPDTNRSFGWVVWRRGLRKDKSRSFGSACPVIAARLWGPEGAPLKMTRRKGRARFERGFAADLVHQVKRRVFGTTEVVP